MIEGGGESGDVDEGGVGAEEEAVAGPGLVSLGLGGGTGGHCDGGCGSGCLGLKAGYILVLYCRDGVLV